MNATTALTPCDVRQARRGFADWPSAVRTARNLLLLVCLFATSCSVDDADVSGDIEVATPTTETTAPTPTPTTSSNRGDSVFTRLLGTAPYPDEGSVGNLTITDFGELFRGASIDRDQLCDDRSAFVDAYTEATDRGSRLFLPDFFKPFPESFDDLPRSFGFTYCDVDGVLNYQAQIHLIEVSAPADEIVEAASSDERWVDDLTTQTINDFTVLDWGDQTIESFNEQNVSPMRRTGIGGQLAVADGIVVRSERSDLLDRVLNPTIGRIIDRPGFASVVATLEAEGAHTIMLTDKPYVGIEAFVPDTDPADIDLSVEERQQQIDAASVGVAPWAMFGIGSVIRPGDTDLGVVVFAHVDEETATANVEQFRAIIELGHSAIFVDPWRETLRIVDIRAEGSFVIARIEAAGERPVYTSLVTAYMSQTSLFGWGTPLDE